MPTAKDITSLRKSGQLTEAFDLGVSLLATEPDNLWTKRAMGWVRYERLKLVAKSDSPEEFLAEWAAISEMVAYNPSDETMLTNQAVWMAVSRLFSLGNPNKANAVLEAVFSAVRNWSFDRPSDLYSALLRAFLKAGKQWSGLGDFLTWWQLSNLRPEDYLPGITNGNKKVMSTAEQAYIAYAKQLLSHPEPVAVQSLIVDLERLHEQHPEYQYPPYYQAKLLVATGSKEEAMTALMPFARRKQGEFWLWDLLAELYDNEPENAIACLCRAVTCSTQEKFLVKARLGLAIKLNKVGKFSEALTELTKSLKARMDEGWNVYADSAEVIEKLQGKGAVILSNNKPLYQQYRPIADNLLYADIPEQVGIVTYLNTDKKVAHFTVNRTISAHFKYGDRMARVQPGDFVAVRLEQRAGKDGSFWVPLSAKPTTQPPSNEIYKSFSGSVRCAVGKEFGFVDDVFVSPTLLKGAVNGSILTGSALWSFDKSKNRHSWKAISAKVLAGQDLQ
jgi:tetratricopeptide (TPR) repeat protein